MPNGIFDFDDAENKDDEERKKPPEAELFAPLQFTSASAEETVRRSGLAWSAGIVFFSAIAFMLFLGWGADLLLGSSPWGLVGGIVIGSIIGFAQFFRLTSQIFPTKTGPAERPLMPHDEDDK